MSEDLNICFRFWGRHNGYKLRRATACPPSAAPQALAGGDASHRIPDKKRFSLQLIRHLASGIWYLLASPARIGPGQANHVIFIPLNYRFHEGLLYICDTDWL